MKSSTPLTATLTDSNSIALTNRKYQKAIKQINKLININTSVKKQLITLQEKYDILREEFIQLEEKYTAAVAENNLILEQQKPFSTSIKYCQSYEEPTSQRNNLIHINQNLVSSSQRRNRQTYSPLSVPNKQLENTGTISQYIDNKRRIEELEEKLAEKNRENAELYEKYIENVNHNQQQKNQNQLKYCQTIERLQREKEFLGKQLQKLQEFVTKQTNEYEALKQKTNGVNQLGNSYELEVKSINITPSACQSPVGFVNINTRDKMSLPFLSSCSGQPSLHNSTQKTQRTDPFSRYYFKKIRDLEAENLKLKKQHSDKKSKYKSQICKLKQEIVARTLNQQQLNNFIYKQQYFIEEFIIKNNIQELKMKGDRPSKTSYPQQTNPQKYNKNQEFHELSLAKNDSFGSSMVKETKLRRQTGGSNPGPYRINTIQSQQYTIPQSQLNQMNFGFNSQHKHIFVQGTKPYKS